MLLLDKVRKSLPSISIAIFLSFQIISYFFINRTLFDLSFVLLGLVIFLTQINYILTKHFALFTFFVLSALFGLYISFIGHKTNSMEPLRLMVHFVVLILMVRYEISIKYIKYILYGYITYTATLILLVGVPSSAILPAASQNFVGWIALGLGLGYYTLLYVQHKKIEFYTAIVVLLFAILCEGRSTIVASVVLLLAVIYTRISQLSLIYKLAFVLFAFTLITLFIVAPGLFDFNISQLDKFQKKGLDLDARDVAIFGYIDKINLKTLFLGVSPKQYPFTILHENLHNSYLALLSLFGIIGFWFLNYLIYVFVRYTYHNGFLCLLLLSFCLRIFTDTVAFVGIFDFFIFYIIYELVKTKTPNQSIVK